MPRPRKTVPTYLHHKPSGRAYVRVPDRTGVRRTVYLGEYDSPASHDEYRRVLAELRSRPGAPPAPTGGPPRPNHATVNEVLLAFAKWAAGHYRRPDGSATTEVGEIRLSLKPVKALYGHTPAAEFGPKALAAVRQSMVDAGLCRTLINRRVERVKRCFKWAASEELIPVTVSQSLATLAGLKKGRSDARESDPVEPVAPVHVAATLPHPSRHVRAMVELQLHTGMRPGEVRTLTLGAVDRSGDVWLYRPDGHKTAYLGKARVIPIGPRARAVLAGFLGDRVPEPDTPLFSPADAQAERFRARRAARKCKIYPSESKAKRKADPKRKPGRVWTATSYSQAVGDACARAGVGPWHPNQLRHTFGTAIRARYGLEAAQVLLGHTRADVTQVYAERNLALALKVAAEAG